MTKLINPLFDAPTAPTAEAARAQKLPSTTEEAAPIATTAAFVGQFGHRRRVPVVVDLRTRSVWPVAKPKE